MSEAPHLRIAPFVREFLPAQALGTAFETGLVDALVEQPGTVAMLATRLGLDPRTLGVLLRILTASGVVVAVDVPEASLAERAGAVALTRTFRDALEFRDLIVATIDFARLVTVDLTERLPLLLRAPEQFMRASALFDLFDYARALGVDPDDLEATRRWVRFTTTLTRYEAPLLLDLGIGQGRTRLIDVGGNSGEFARQACERDAALQATVVDLPAVCALGRTHVAGSPAAGRIAFLARDALNRPLPRGDWVNFKSMLHDWPDPAARMLLRRGCDALPAGGMLSILERSSRVPDASLTSYAFAPMIPFLHGFRQPDWYVERLRECGLTDLRSRTVMIDSEFLVVTGVKP